MNTTLGKLSTGAIFRFGHDKNEQSRGFLWEKTSRMTARNLRTREVGYNALTPQEADDTPVTYVASTRSMLPA